MAAQTDTQTASRNPIIRSISRNPVVLKEMRGRMRGARAFIVLTVFLALMSAFALVLYGSFALSSDSVTGPSGQIIGKIVFGGLVAIELFLVIFISPAFTAGAISGERERQTYDLLRTTLLSARSLVLGKLSSSLSFVVLLLFAAVPLQSLAFLLGGVAAEELWISLLMLLVTAIAYAALGLFFSSMMRRTLVASVMTYAVALLTTIGLPLMLLVMLAMLGPVLDSVFDDLPIVFEYVVLLVFWFLLSTNPLAAAITTEVLLVQDQTIWFYDLPLLSSGSTYIPVPSPWIPYLLIYSLVSLVLIVLSIQFVRRKEQ